MKNEHEHLCDLSNTAICNDHYHYELRLVMSSTSTNSKMVLVTAD